MFPIVKRNREADEMMDLLETFLSTYEEEVKTEEECARCGSPFDGTDHSRCL